MSRNLIIIALFMCLALTPAIQGQSNPALNIPDQCICSPATPARYSKPSSTVVREVYVANCSCPPQSCAVSWTTENSRTGITMDCTDTKATKEPSNCVDFTSVPKHKITAPEQFGLFQVVPLKWTNFAQTEIGVSGLTDDTGKEAIYAPDSLRFNPSTEIRLPGVTTRLEVTYIAGQPGGIKAYWLNRNGQYKVVTQGAGDVQYKVVKQTFSDPAGFDKIIFQTVEHSYLRMCSFR